MSYTVSAADLSTLTLNETDTVPSVLQNVAIVLATRRGTVPLHRDMGLSLDYLDKPINVAKVLLVADVKEAVERYEPRAEVVSVNFAVNPTDPRKLIPTVEVNIIGS